MADPQVDELVDCFGFEGENPIPRPPYHCAKCKKISSSYRIQRSTMHFKHRRRSQSGFAQSWSLWCPDPRCDGRLRVRKFVPAVQQAFNF